MVLTDNGAPFVTAAQSSSYNTYFASRFQEAERQRFLNEQEKLDRQTKFRKIADHYRELRDNKKQLYAPAKGHGVYQVVQAKLVAEIVTQWIPEQ